MGTSTKQKTPVKTKKPAAKRPNMPHIYIVGALIAALLLVVGLLVWFYQGRALPNVTAGGLQVGNMTSQQIREAIVNQVPMRVTFVNNGQKLTVPLSTLGVKVDVDATINAALQARKQGDWLSNFWLWQTRQIPLVFTNDPGKLKLFLQNHYPSIFINPKDAQLIYNNGLNRFLIKAGTDGQGIDLRAFESSLPQLALNPHDFTVDVKPGVAKPLIDENGLKQAQKFANKRVNLAIRFTLHGKAVYRADKDQIASWAHVIPNTVTGVSHIEFDKAKVKQFITSQVGPSIVSPPINRKVVIDKASGATNVISPGQDGHSIDGAGLLANDILRSVRKGEDITKEVKIVPIHFKTVTMQGFGKWIEVDLTKQTTNLYVGNNLVASYLISSGTARTPTQVGEFAVYAKYPLKTMTGTILGEYYYVPNIKWVSFFDGGEAFHGTYWHHNFGHPMSHGCINMTEPDAKVLYDFAPIGTKVIVHY